MSQLLTQRSLVIGVASSALFDLADSDDVFRTQGVEKYAEYQEDHVDEPFRQGVAFPFISRILEFNKVFKALKKPEQGVEVIVMSRNSPRTGLRVMNSIEHYGLDITRSIFRSGMSTFSLMKVFNMSLFLSANAADVDAAVAEGFPAGCVKHYDGSAETSDKELRIAFDFDGVLAGDSSERMYQDEKERDPKAALKRYGEYEKEHANQPLEEGPLKPLLVGIDKLQNAAKECTLKDKPSLRVSLVTARNAPAHERAIRTLESWGLDIDDAFFLGGLDKAPVLNELRPHIFFDDQMANLDSEKLSIPSVHIPFGIRNNSPRD